MYFISQFNDVVLLFNEFDYDDFHFRYCLNLLSDKEPMTTRLYMIAPALDKKFVKSKGKVWFENYLYSEKEILRDEFQTRCTQIPKKDSAIANEILKYLF